MCIDRLFDSDSMGNDPTFGVLQDFAETLLSQISLRPVRTVVLMNWTIVDNCEL